MKPIRVCCYSIVPSPYQRDLFYELSRLTEVDLQVYYLEPASPDSPWPQKPLQPYEKILRGGYLAWGGARFHWNWHLPNLKSCDVVILNGYQNLIAQWVLHTQAHRTPCVFWGEKMVASVDGIKGQLQKLLAQGLNHCWAIAAIGSKAEQDYRQRFPHKPTFNIPYYCTLSEFSVDLPPRPRNPITILFCGQMIARKGVDILLQAFEQLIQSGLSARLLLVGREAELPQMLASRTPHIIQQIEYAGFQAPEDLPHFFRQADLFVLPSRYDGWGVVMNQALGAGLPIICSDAVGAAQDLVEPGVNGAIFPAGDQTALFEALAFYVEQPSTIQFASQASLLKATKWSPRAGADRWLSVFQAITHCLEHSQP
ncbi:MAG: glycosyltransferase family 4 protein [Oculatellaceae cyanobacterium bins.114]|nr:glycosyltransferase family 4 protein [Oculatellaceae cyanobacterium bins.114]